MPAEKHIKNIDFVTGLRWVCIDATEQKQIDWLKQNFAFNELDLTDCLPSSQRPKLTEYDDYIFMILQFPHYSSATGEIEASEIDFFIGRNFLITVHNNQLPPINELFRKYNAKKKKETGNHLGEHPAVLLYEILNDLLHYCFPILNHINQDIDAVETRIFNIDHNKIDIIREIMRIKHNIVYFRKAMQAHKSIIQKLINRSEKLFATHKLQVYYNNLVNHTKDIWDFLENYKDTINALHETHESLVSQHLNQIIKTLTIFSVVVFPLTLFASVFGMNTIDSMPFINSPYGFWFIIAIMILAMLGMISYFKHKKWI